MIVFSTANSSLTFNRRSDISFFVDKNWTGACDSTSLVKYPKKSFLPYIGFCDCPSSHLYLLLHCSPNALCLLWKQSINPMIVPSISCLIVAIIPSLSCIPLHTKHLYDYWEILRKKRLDPFISYLHRHLVLSLTICTILSIYSWFKSVCL